MLRKISWKTYRIFLGGKHTHNREEIKALTWLQLSLLPKMGESFIFNENETLNPRVGN